MAINITDSCCLCHSICIHWHLHSHWLSSHFEEVFQQQKAAPPANLLSFLTAGCSRSHSGHPVLPAALSCWCLRLLNRTFLLAHNLLNQLYWIGICPNQLLQQQIPLLEIPKFHRHVYKKCHPFLHAHQKNIHLEKGDFPQNHSQLETRNLLLDSLRFPPC